MISIDMLEDLVKHPQKGLSCIENIDKNIADHYKDSDFHEVRRQVSGDKYFSDMSHITPACHMNF